jgi:hypothetical protein
LFGGIWFFQALAHGDIEYYNKMRHSDKPVEFTTQSSFTPCAREIYGFMSAYLFSIELQQSIGELKGISRDVKFDFQGSFCSSLWLSTLN